MGVIGQGTRAPNADAAAGKSANGVDVVLIEVPLLRVGNRLANIGSPIQLQIGGWMLDSKDGIEIVACISSSHSSRRRYPTAPLLWIQLIRYFQPRVVNRSIVGEARD